jgi:hypothetical protein
VNVASATVVGAEVWEATMASTEVCIVCGQAEDTRRLGVWLVDGARALVHVDCWIAEYDARNVHIAPVRRTA